MKMKSMSKRKLQAMETKKKIFETAQHLVLEHGFENVSVDSIVKAADVSKGTFYVHFESKDALAAALVYEYTNTTDKDYKSFLTSLPDQNSVFDTLLLLAEEITEFIATNIGLENMRVLYKAHLTKTINTTPAMSYDRDLYKMFTEVLERGIRQSELREDIPVEFLSKHLIMAIRGITYEWCIRFPDFDLKKQVQEHFKILLYGLKK
ncbi:MAG: TetR/AcrR family transcriptional regulator [Ruminiclostridium sp.]|jgi:AcrR family transcriptional regulator|nr:TetR/AcrR family transcriptional regulator [Ruminiclostridium sp.]